MVFNQPGTNPEPTLPQRNSQSDYISPWACPLSTSAPVVQRKLKAQRRELQDLSRIQAEVAEEEDAQQSARLRRKVGAGAAWAAAWSGCCGKLADVAKKQKVSRTRSLTHTRNTSWALLQLDREERLAAEPPKLSKHKFQPMPLQVGAAAV